ncbi:hypothetical protein D9M69_584150 [compost metagenome]
MAQKKPSKVCGPWRLTASLHGVESSSRCGEFQVAAQPRNAASTKRVWKIIRTGASSMENNISRSIDRVTLNLPPNSFAPLAQIRMMLNSFGRNSSTMVVENNAIALSGCHCGHSG